MKDLVVDRLVKEEPGLVLEGTVNHTPFLSGLIADQAVKPKNRIKRTELILDIQSTS